MENILPHFKSFDFLEIEELEVIQSAIKIKTIKKGEYLFRKGTYFYDACFVLKGLMRIYDTDSSGLEKNVYFSLEGSQVACLESILKKEKGVFFAQALEDTTVLALDTIIMDKAEKNFPNLLRLKMADMERFVFEAIERVHFFTMLSPEERFLQLQEKQPDLLKRVPQKYLASYIGVSTVSFSRIKARIMNKEKGN